MSVHVNIIYDVYDNVIETTYRISMGDVPGLTEISELQGPDMKKVGSITLNEDALQELIPVLQNRLAEARKETKPK